MQRSNLQCILGNLRAKSKFWARTMLFVRNLQLYVSKLYFFKNLFNQRLTRRVTTSSVVGPFSDKHYKIPTEFRQTLWVLKILTLPLNFPSNKGFSPKFWIFWTIFRQGKIWGAPWHGVIGDYLGAWLEQNGRKAQVILLGGDMKAWQSSTVVGPVIVH